MASSGHAGSQGGLNSGAVAAFGSSGADAGAAVSEDIYGGMIEECH